MIAKIVVLDCKHLEGVSKKSGKPYSFYSGHLYSELGYFDFSSDIGWASGIDFPAKRLNIIEVELTMKEGKCSIKPVKN